MAPASLELAGAGAGAVAVGVETGVEVFLADEEKSIGLPSLSCFVDEKHKFKAKMDQKPIFCPGDETNAVGEDNQGTHLTNRSK